MKSSPIGGGDLTCHESITQAKSPSRILSFSKFDTFLLKMVVEEFLPVMIDLQPQPELLQRLSKLMNQISKSRTYRVLLYLKLIPELSKNRDWAHFFAPMFVRLKFWVFKNWHFVYILFTWCFLFWFENGCLSFINRF